MPWPNDPCPPGGPTTAADLIAQIIELAHTNGCPDPEFRRIVRAGIKCAADAHGAYAGPPSHPPTHCDSLQQALVFAGASQWAQCVGEMEHGT